MLIPRSVKEPVWMYWSVRPIKSDLQQQAALPQRVRVFIGIIGTQMTTIIAINTASMAATTIKGAAKGA